MTQNTHHLARFVIVGANHRSSSLDVREKLNVGKQGLARLYQDLSAVGIDASVVITTNDRMEILIIDDGAAGVSDKVLGVLADHGNITVAELSGQLFTFTGAEALAHLFSLAAGLASIVPGDLRLASRIHDCLEVAREHSHASDELTAIVEAALVSAQRVARETELGSRPGSMAAAAEQVVRDLYGDPATCSALLIGTGDMGELLANHLHQAGLKEFCMVGGLPTRSERIAASLEGDILPLDDLSACLVKADVVITCLGSRGRFVDPHMVKEALKARRNKPIFLIDAVLPGDVEPSVDLVENVFLYDLNDLEQMVMTSRVDSEAAIKAAGDIVDEELAAYGGIERAEEAQAVLGRIKARLRFAVDEAVGGMSREGAPSALIEACRRQLNEENTAILEAVQSAMARGDAQWSVAFLSHAFGLKGPQKDGEE